MQDDLQRRRAGDENDDTPRDPLGNTSWQPRREPVVHPDTTQTRPKSAQDGRMKISGVAGRQRAKLHAGSEAPVFSRSKGRGRAKTAPEGFLPRNARDRLEAGGAIPLADAVTLASSSAPFGVRNIPQGQAVREIDVPSARNSSGDTLGRSMEARRASTSSRSSGRTTRPIGGSSRGPPSTAKYQEHSGLTSSRGKKRCSRRKLTPRRHGDSGEVESTYTHGKRNGPGGVRTDEDRGVDAVDGGSRIGAKGAHCDDPGSGVSLAKFRALLT